jgi:PAS domain S-box-containing protein
MVDTAKTKAVLIRELQALRQQLAAWEAQAALSPLTPQEPLSARPTQRGPSDDTSPYQVLVEWAFHGLYVHQDAIIQFASPTFARTFGYATPQELIGQDYRVLVPVHERARLEAYCLARLQGKFPSIPCEIRGRKKDGTLLWLECMAAPLSWHGKPAIATVYLDIAERKHWQDRLRRTQKMQAIETLARGIAHEFNNMLQVILGFTDLTQYEVPQGSVAWRNLQTVLTTGRRAKDLVQQILAFSRQREPERIAVDFASFVPEVLELLQTSLPSNITLQYDHVPDTKPVLADPAQMQQVLLHLCANAEHAMRDTGGVLAIRVEPFEVDSTFATTHPPLHPGPHVQITVRDTGHGMPPEILERLFEPFFTTKGVGEGTGMGLAIVEGIVARHEGIITVQSQHETGTTCTIYLPRATTAPATVVRPDVLHLRGTERILFVDDEAALVVLGQRMLERLGYDVVGCTSGAEALQLFHTTPQRFDVIIADQVMPDITGEQLAAALRQLQADIPFILCTGLSYKPDPEKMHTLGIRAFLLKPLEVRDLALAVRQVLVPQQPQQA